MTKVTLRNSQSKLYQHLNDMIMYIDLLPFMDSSSLLPRAGSGRCCRILAELTKRAKHFVFLSLLLSHAVNVKLHLLCLLMTASCCECFLVGNSAKPAWSSCRSQAMQKEQW